MFIYRSLLRFTLFKDQLCRCTMLPSIGYTKLTFVQRTLPIAATFTYRTHLRLLALYKIIQRKPTLKGDSYVNSMYRIPYFEICKSLLPCRKVFLQYICAYYL